MASLDLVDSLVIAENPWSGTDLGNSSHYIRTKASGGVSDAQLQQQQEFSDAVDAFKNSSACNDVDGMAYNRCRALWLKDRLS